MAGPWETVSVGPLISILDQEGCNRMAYALHDRPELIFKVRFISGDCQLLEHRNRHICVEMVLVVHDWVDAVAFPNLPLT